ncbi:hypothetical protein NM208_g1569 [Fusarium decemcellulare]|uniref:Uncharacterized protein n=1 Tax=Fusarium decemcellulare TaxID=57161 RepID=A0ACC1SVF9_9HYPO|nr:hypothetical protein NM208_g1569 [Fusarium decemcellulare]
MADMREREQPSPTKATYVGEEKKTFEVDDARSTISVSAGHATLPSNLDGTTDLSFWTAVRTWPFASLWSLMFSSTMILVAYGPAWIAQLFALPAFTSRFGFEYGEEYVISAQWQSALSACSMLGQLLGAPGIAIMMDKFGRKSAFMFALILGAACVFVQFFSSSLSVLVAGTLLVGLSLGCFSVICLTYSMEVAPLQLRGILGGLYSFGIITGPLLSVAVAQATVNMSSAWAYRIGFAIQWAWPVMLFPLSLFAPESPVWLIRKGRIAEAGAALARLAVKGYDVRPDLSQIIIVDREERVLDKNTSYQEIFKGPNLRRTTIACVCYCTIITTGNALANSSAFYMILGGVDAKTGFFWSLGCGLAALLGAFASLGILAKLRRRPIYIWSQLASAILLFVIGFVQLAPDYYEKHDAIFGQGALMVLWNVVYGAAISPISTVIMGEVPSNALRPKTVAFSTMVQQVMVLLVLVINPYLLNPEFAHLQGYVGFIAGASGLVTTVWIFFFVPETSLPIQKLDLLFRFEVGTRHFTTYKVAELEGRASSL